MKLVHKERAISKTLITSVKYGNDAQTGGTMIGESFRTPRGVLMYAIVFQRVGGRGGDVLDT